MKIVREVSRVRSPCWSICFDLWMVVLSFFYYLYDLIKKSISIEEQNADVLKTILAQSVARMFQCSSSFFLFSSDFSDINSRYIMWSINTGADSPSARANEPDMLRSGAGHPDAARSQASTSRQLSPEEEAQRLYATLNDYLLLEHKAQPRLCLPVESEVRETEKTTILTCTLHIGLAVSQHSWDRLPV